MLDAVTVAADANKFLHVRIPGCDVFVPYRPVGADALLAIGFKVEIAPALRPSCPHQRLATDLVTFYPVEWFFLNVGMFVILCEKMLCRFRISITACGDGIFFFYILREIIPV